MIAPFGGGLEDDETTQDCLKREMLEELELKLSDDNIDSLGIFESHGHPNHYIEMFISTNIDKENLILHEGKAVVELSVDDALKHNKVTNFTKKVLKTLL
jgi:8-oxo-dGTP pyrophosphatase MutT (NUDIX family)